MSQPNKKSTGADKVPAQALKNNALAFAHTLLPTVNLILEKKGFSRKTYI